MGHCSWLPDYPFVIKGTGGGEGAQTWLIKNQEDFKQAIDLLKHLEIQGIFGFVLQEFIPGLQRDLRVVIIGNHIQSYWRVNKSSFFHNVSRGGQIDFQSDLELQARGKDAVRELCVRTGINLAGFDLVFSEKSDIPLFIEINYVFGRTGLGGSDTFYKILNTEVNQWIETCG
jgi:ribosomal protein S6--L-glutamate ligase